MTKVINVKNNAAAKNELFTKGVPFLAKVKTGNEVVTITIYFNMEKKSNVRTDTCGHIWVGEEHCGMFRHTIGAPIPCWYPDPKGNGIGSAWRYGERQNAKLEVIKGEPDALGIAILRAEWLYLKKKGVFASIFNNLLTMPVFRWNKEDFMNIGVVDSDCIDKILAACEESKPQKLQDLVALESDDFDKESYDKAVEILSRLEFYMNWKCVAL